MQLQQAADDCLHGYEELVAIIDAHHEINKVIGVTCSSSCRLHIVLWSVLTLTNALKGQYTVYKAVQVLEMHMIYLGPK